MINLKEIIKKNPILLAPMDDVTDIAFRELCEKYGCCYSTTELTSVEALIREKVNPTRYMKGDLKINSIQLFGSNPKSFILASNKIKSECDIIDINFGCPSPNVTGGGSGSILLKDPKNVYEIVSELVKSNPDIPITAKIRLGYEKTNSLQIAKEIEKAGAKMLIVHGRTAKQKYSGKANWDAIREIYENLKIPVIGNGDICCEEDIDKYLNKYCDGIMIGRAAIGNPLIFKRFNYYLKNKKKLEIKDKKKIQKELFLEYLKILEKYKEIFPRIELKIQRQSMWFMKGIEGAKELRKKIILEKDIKKIISLIKNF
jgi:nifR3 family TIM-barrel protein